MRQRMSRVASGAQPCHFYQQLGLETCDRGRVGRTVVCLRCADQEKRMNGFQNRADLWGLAMGNRGYLGGVLMERVRREF